MTPKLSKAAVQLREQFDDSYPDRDRTSDGWIGDTRHGARKSDHNPDVKGWVRAIDIDRDLSGKAKPDLMPDLVDQIRLESAPLFLGGSGASTQGLTNTITMCISALRKKLIYWVNFIKYLC